MLRVSLLLACCLGHVAASSPPTVCPAGSPIGDIDLRVASASIKVEPLPLRTINRLEEGDILLYKPLTRGGEKRTGEVLLVLVPVNKGAAGEKLIVLEPKPAAKPQQWKVPVRTAVVAYVYGPSGLSSKKVRSFLTRDDDLVTQLADYAEKTAQTEALIAALASPDTSAAAVQSALQGFSGQYGLNVHLDKTAPSDQQALAMFRALNPQMASYDPITPQRSRQFSQTASLATSVAALFFGSPVGLAAGGTAMLMEVRSLVFPNAEFRSSFGQSISDDGVGLCGRRDGVSAHTKLAYLWAMRVPNIGPPRLEIEKGSSLPSGLKSPLPFSAADSDWKYVQRARNWMMIPEAGKPVPVSVVKLGESRNLELDIGPAVKAGTYTLAANWDWNKFTIKGEVVVRPLSEFGSARLTASSQDLLVAKTGKVPVTLKGGDFEFVTKIEVLKLDDRFATPASVPFILPKGLREGPQDHVDMQLNTIDMDTGSYKLSISQLDGKPHAVNIKILAAPPELNNFPVVLNEGALQANFALTGERLDLLNRMEVAHGSAELGEVSADRKQRKLTLRMKGDLDAGTSLAVKAFIQDRSEPLTFADAVRIVGPRPQITEVALSAPPDQDVQLQIGELPGGGYLSAMMRVQHLQSNSTVELSCDGPEPVRSLVLHLGERSGPLNLQQLAPDQIFLSFDTSAWPNGCPLQATIVNGSEGKSQSYKLGRLVRVPKIEKFEIGGPDETKDGVTANLTGENLEMIEKVGWSEDQVEAIADLPLPIPGDGQRQKLQVHLPAPPASHAPLYVMLRSETKPRITKSRS